MSLASSPPGEWAAVDLPLAGDISFRTGTWDQVHASRPDEPGDTVLRVLQHSRLTPATIHLLLTKARSVVSPKAHTHNRELLALLWKSLTPVSDHQMMIYDAARRLRRVAPDAAEAHARAAFSAFRHVHDVIVEVQRGASERSLDDVLASWRQMVDVVLTPEPPPSTTFATIDPVVTMTPAPVPPEQGRRASLLALGWPTSTEVGKRAGKKAAAQWAKDRRDAGQLLGVWDATVNTFRYPDFQFDPAGQPLPQVAELLAALAEHPDRTAEADPDGWRRAYWLYQPVRSLSRDALLRTTRPLPSDASAGTLFQALMLSPPETTPEDHLSRTPAEAFVEAPAAVIALARQAAAAARPDTDAEGRAHADHV